MNDIVTCPYNIAHAVKRSRLQIHLMKCEKTSKNAIHMKMCNFNSSHRILREKMDKHIEVCPDRIKYDERRHLALMLANNNYDNPIYQFNRQVTTKVPEIEGDWTDDDDNEATEDKIELDQELANIEENKVDFLDIWIKEAEDQKSRDFDERVLKKDGTQDCKLAADNKIRKRHVDLDGASTASTIRGHDDSTASNTVSVGGHDNISASRDDTRVFPKLRNVVNNSTPPSRYDTSDDEYDLPAVHTKSYDRVLGVRRDDDLVTDDVTDGDDEASSVASHAMAGSQMYKIFKKINLKN